MPDVAGRIGALFIYPIKGCHAIAMGTSPLLPTGLEHDRAWALTTPSGRVLTQRECAKLATARPGIHADGSLDVQIGDQRLPLPQVDDGAPFEVRVWGDTVMARRHEGAVVAAFSELLGREVALVSFPTDARRACDPTYAPADAHTHFSDGFPLLVTTTSSLARLDEQLLELGAEPVPMDRFRPNIVLDNVPAGSEDEHDDLIIAGGVSDIHIALVKACDRCVVTTIDQERGVEDGDQPLSTLRRLRRHPLTRKPIFGQNGVPRLPNGAATVIRVGDPVTLSGSAHTGG